MAEITFTLDGEEAVAVPGDTILQVATRLGKHIPTLCHDPRLEPFTSCYVCLVELEGRPGFVPSCATKVVPGMKVRTAGPEVISARKLALELLMSAHTADCVAPCRLQCPDNIDIQTYIAHIAAGEFGEALKTIKLTNPFPSVCGRVCPHTCELQCRRNKVDEPVAINPLKRFVADLDRRAKEPYRPSIAPDSGKKVAVIGAGPAGLTAAYYLRQKGHAVTVFEMNPKAGGMLRYGIPRYRLPDDALDAEIAHIVDTGVEMRYNRRLGRDFGLTDLRHEGYDAAIVTVGAWSSTPLGVPDEDAPGMMAGIEFLRRVAEGERPNIGRSVVVVGGGNTAIDAARTARRLGAEVSIIYRRTRREMPAEAYEVDEAEHEGVQMQFLVQPVGLVLEGGRVRGIRAIRMELGEPDASGRRRPVPVPDSDFETGADTVIAAVGQRSDPASWTGDDAPAATRWGTVEADETTYQTGQDWVFTAGDCLTGTATAIEAIAGGRKAAMSVDRYLQGKKLLPIGKPFSDSIGRLEDIAEDMFADVARAPRAVGRMLPFEERAGNFKEVELGLTVAQALAESARCMECGCATIDTCTFRRYCDEYGIDPNRFGTEFRHRRVADSHPFIIYDPNKCIMCGRCVRICLEQQGLGALGFVGRGFETTIMPSLGRPLLETECDACGQCVGTCPSGALEVKRVLPKRGPYQPDCTEVVCGFCGVGCRLTIEATHGRYVRAAAAIDRHHNRGNLCVDGSFGHRYLETLPRLTEPAVRGERSGWEDAVEAAAAGLARARQGKGVAVLVSGALTNEDAYLLARLARTALGTNRIASLDGPPAPAAFRAALGSGGGIRLEDLMSADSIWVVGSDPFEYAPVAGIELRRAALAGVPLTVVGARATRLDHEATRILRLGERHLPALFAALAAGHRGDAEALEAAAEAIGIKPAWLRQALERLAAAERPVIAVSDDLDGETAAALGELLAALGIEERVLLLRRGGNSLGRELMGLHPTALPGGLDAQAAADRRLIERVWGSGAVTGPGPELDEMLRQLASGELGGLLLVSADPYGPPLAAGGIHPDVFVVAVEVTPGEVTARADVVLPAPAPAEVSGSFVTLDGRVLPTEAVRAPAGGRTLFAILRHLAEAAGSPVPSERPAAVWAELERLSPGLAALAPAGLDLDGRPWAAEPTGAAAAG